MPSARIKITPEELLTQAGEMNALQEEFSNLFGSVTVELVQVNKNWSANLAHNFNGKISSFNKNHMLLIQDLMRGSGVAKTCAETFESIDSQLAKTYENNQNIIQDENEVIIDPEEMYNRGYLQRAPDAEYALLNDIFNDVAKENKSEQEVLDDFYKALKQLPESSPLRYITKDQITITHNQKSGFSAVAVKDNHGGAMVIFAGTNGNSPMSDILNGDLQIALGGIIPGLGGLSSQVHEANLFIKDLSKDCSNIVVTGYSLGGYLARDVTLNYGCVSNCVLFDPPGMGIRGELIETFNLNSQASKITTYFAGSEVSRYGYQIGDVVTLDVQGDGKNTIEAAGFTVHNHKIEYMYDALGGEGAITAEWEGTCPAKL